LPSPTGPLTQAAEPPPAPLPAGTLPPAPNAATPATADATGAKPETDIKAPDLSQITTPGGPTSEAPALPPLPDTDSANANGNTDEGATGDSSNGNNYFRSERLPDTIYKKKYDRLNKHLPTALYENQVDGLVFLTAKHDDLNGLRAVLDTGRSMELVDAEGDTPLLVAVKHNAINTSRLLLARHANFNITDRNGMTPIQIAEQQGNYQLVRAIEAAGASASQ
jgi:hypothetical protein